MSFEQDLADAIASGLPFAVDTSAEGKSIRYYAGAELVRHNVRQDEAQARSTAEAARQAAAQAALADIDPADVNSIPALRDRVQAIIEILRDRFGV